MRPYQSLLPLLLACSCLVFPTDGEVQLPTLDFGDPLGDNFGPYGPEAVSNAISLQGEYIFYGREEDTLFISENGVVSFREAFPDAFPRQLPLPTGLETPTPALIAGFWGDINVEKNGGAIFFIEMDSSNENRFGESKARVLNHLRNGFGNTMEDFDPTHIFLVTWEAVHQNDPGIAQRAVTFQIVMATDSERTYVLLLYSDVRWDRSNGHGVLVGFNAGDGERSFTHPLHTNNLTLELHFSSNANTDGVFVYRVDKSDIVEPTQRQRQQSVCVMSFKAGEEQQYQCTCPEERPVLSVNGINCLLTPLALKFFNNTPSVSGGNVTAYFQTNREGVELHCQLPRTSRRRREDCSSGQFHHSGLTPNTYSLRIVAKDPITDERAILRGDFTVIGDKDEEFCGVTIINTGTEVKNGETEVHFTGVGATKSFKCRMDKERSKPCESPFHLKNISPGLHRVVVVPKGCDKGNTKSSSVRFIVNS